MDPIELATIVTAVSTVIYTVGTFLLWRSTNKTTELMSKAYSSDQYFKKSTAYHAVINGHRDLYLSVLTNDNLLNIFSKARNMTIDETRAAVLATLFINHAFRIFTDLYETNLLDPLEKESFISDAKVMFSYDFVKNVWPTYSKYYSNAFSTFVTDNLKVE